MEANEHKWKQMKTHKETTFNFKNKENNQYKLKHTKKHNRK